MKLAVAKRRKAGDTELLRGEPSRRLGDAFFGYAIMALTPVTVLEPIIDNMTFSECDLTELVLALFAVLRQLIALTAYFRSFAHYLITCKALHDAVAYRW